VGPNVAGVVVLAGPTRSLGAAVVDQLTYLASLEAEGDASTGAPASGSQTVIEQARVPALRRRPRASARR
jgi:hypothetical protein